MFHKFPLEDTIDSQINECQGKVAPPREFLPCATGCYDGWVTGDGMNATAELNPLNLLNLMNINTAKT
jgi:hypothetical protein